MKTSGDAVGHRTSAGDHFKGQWQHRTFVVGVLLKGLNGVLELIAGTALLLISGASLDSLIVRLTASEIAEDPTGRVTHFLRWLGDHLSTGTKLFASLYLLAHGVVKLFLVVSLLRERLWAFPVAIAAMLAMITYQGFRLTQHFSPILAGFTVLDAFVTAFIWMEWRRRVAIIAG